MYEHSLMYNNMLMTMDTARRRTTTTRAALSATTAGVWSVHMHSEQGPAEGEWQQCEVISSKGKLSVQLHACQMKHPTNARMFP